MLDKIIKFIASPSFALTCMLTGAGLVGLVLFPLQFLGIPGDQVAELASRGVPFVAVYLLLTLSAIACFRKRLKLLPKLLAVSPRLPNRESETLSDKPFTPSSAARALRRAGFRHVVITEDMAHGTKWPLSPMGNYLLHGALVLGVAAAALAVIPNTDFIGRYRVAQGDFFNGQNAKFSEIVTGKRRDVPSFFLQSVKGDSVDQRPASLSVTVQPSDGRVRRITSGWPWISSLTTMVVAEDFGVSYRFTIVASGTAEPLATASFDSTSHASNTREYFEIEARNGKRYRIGVLAASRPGRTDLKMPAAVSFAETASASGGWRLLARTDSMTIGTIMKTGEVWLRLDDTRPHAVLRVHRSFTAPLALLSLLCGAIGSFMRLGLPRTEAVLERTTSGHTAIRTAADVYRTATRSHDRLARQWEEAS